MKFAGIKEQFALENKRLKKNKLLFCYNLQIKHKKEETEYEKESKEVV